jgi:hypothetical protein
MFNRVAVVVRAIAKFWNLEPALGLPGEASAGLVSKKMFARRAKFSLALGHQLFA